MNIVEGQYYKHRRMSDVYFRVNEVKDDGTLNISWYLVKSDLPMGLSEDVEIPNMDYRYYTEWPPISEKI